MIPTWVDKKVKNIRHLSDLGSMSVIYTGTLDQKRVSIKVRRKKHKGLLSEAKVLSKMLHPLIPKIHLTREGVIVLDFVPGQDLFEYIQGLTNYLNEKTLKVIMWQITHTLKHIHEKKCMHRDVKPENIIIDAKTKVTLIDFG